jgi:hypothetical protein
MKIYDTYSNREDFDDGGDRMTNGMSQVQTTENLDKLAYTRFRKQPVGFSQ